jgi:hypothetical protein
MGALARSWSAYQRSVMRTVKKSCVVMVLLASPIALADNLSAVPEVFVGSSVECGGIAGSNIVTSAWLRGMGLPDNGGANTTTDDLATNPNKRDPHTGLLMSKNGPTPDCSSAEARIEGWKKGTVLTELGFDYRNGGHCGAGAPRFDITTTDGFIYFAGCAAGLHEPAPQDPLQWTRVRFLAAGASACLFNVCVFPQLPTNPPFVFGTTPVDRIDIVYDEGTDVPILLDDPSGIGLAVLDNIDVNGVLITTGTGICPSGGDKDGSCPGAQGRDSHDGEGD